MKVLKFGGTSVGSVEGILNIKAIAEQEQAPVIVVVSALTTITDSLVKATKLAEQGDAAYQTVLDDIVARHRRHVEAVIPAARQAALMDELNVLFEELAGILHGVSLIRDVTQKTADMIVCYGERLSSRILATLIEGCLLVDSRQIIKTTRADGERKAGVDYEQTNRLVREAFKDLDRIAIAPGFIASDSVTGEPTTLGRGGSDYTAAIIAAALDADCLEIWTDVDGFMTADPRLVPAAYTIQELTYNEAMELCNFGAKVVYPPTIYPVRKKQIPIYIKNTLNRDFPGSVILQQTTGAKRGVRGLSAIRETSLINVSGMAMVGVIGVNRRIFSTLAQNGISVFMVAQTSSETSTSLCTTTEDAPRAEAVLNEEFSQEIATGAMNPMERMDGLATIAVVGEGMKHAKNLAGRLFSALGRNGISVVAMAQGASEMNISATIERKHLEKAAKVIHDSFFLSDYQLVNIFLCGIGTVGSSLLRQLREQHDLLMEKHHVGLNVVGLANSRHALFCESGIDLSNYKAALEAAPSYTKEELAAKVIGMNLYNAVFVDCTASADIADIYQTLLDNNVSIVAANKIAASSDYANYEQLKRTATYGGVKFLYETNVGAGLPIIKTINDLCASGDEILEIQAVLSGTLNFVFTSLSEENRLSDVIRMAKEQGISEPDPRIDLSGKDVLRKLVILVREAGIRINQEDVNLQPFVPAKYFEGTTAEFMERVKELDAEFEALRAKTEAAGKRLRFIARWQDGKATVSLCEVGQESPFYQLAATNNVVLITTKRYREYPMIIQGYGAGADVTAAGVFADIMRMANI